MAKEKQHSTANPNPVDVHVGSKVRARRILLGITQEEIADDLGVSFQQIQKYEKGANRISASRLFDIANILGCSVEHFFEGFDRNNPKPEPDIIDERISLELIRHFHDISSEATRRHAYALIKSIAEGNT